MIVRAILIALLSVGIAGFGGIAWVTTRSPAAQAAQPAQAAKSRIPMLVMGRALTAGSLLKPDDLATEERLVSDLPDDSNPDTAEIRRSLNGAMLRRSVAAGDLIRSGDVTRPGDHGFLAAVLAPGLRAVTVGVDAISGSAGLIWPGDRIDVILTQSIDGENIPAAHRVAAETVLHDVRVIAIDQRLVQGAAPGGPEAQTARTVTLEVTENQAALVSVATRIGRLSLAVRSAPQPGVPASANADAQAAALESLAPVWAGDVSRALPATAAKASPKTLRVYQGSREGKDYPF